MDSEEFNNVAKYTKAFLENGDKVQLLAWGNLQKKAKKGKGAWLTRWMEVRGPYLMYWQNMQKSQTKSEGEVTMPAGVYDLRRVTTVEMGASGELALHFFLQEGHKPHIK